MSSADIRPYPARRVTARDTSSQPAIWPAGTTAPSANLVAGDLWLDTGTGTHGTLMCYNGTAWKTVAALS